MRVLVTGGGGFLGRHVLQALAEAGHDPVSAGHDTPLPTELRLAEQVEDLFSEVRPEAVVHLAGTSRREDFARGPVEVRTENVSHPLLNVLEQAGRRRVVAVSTALVWGEGPLGDGVAPRPRDLYGAARATAEVMGARRAQGDFLLLRPFLLLGEGAPPCELFDARSAWFRADTAVDVLHAHDAALAVATVLSRGAAGMAYTLASGGTMTLASLVESGRVRAEPLPPGEGPSRLWSASAAALRALGWRPGSQDHPGA